MKCFFLLNRCTELGEAISEYISDGIECSIRAYNAPSWPERNSSTLLFSAMMTRVFGVQRSKQTESINIKNKMTGCVFFIRLTSAFSRALDKYILLNLFKLQISTTI